MKKFNLKCMVRVKKYRSYKGKIGQITPNLINRNFTVNAPKQKWTTDITQFELLEQKLYLASILDMYNSEIISYNISECLLFSQVMDVLNKTFEKISDNTNLILNSDQDW